jgi:hypothetical protein
MQYLACVGDFNLKLNITEKSDDFKEYLIEQKLILDLKTQGKFYIYYRTIIILRILVYGVLIIKYFHLFILTNPKP